MSEAAKGEVPDKVAVASAEERTCGLVMPIGAIDGCGADHWLEVKGIVTEAIEEIRNPTFKVRLVSDADEVGIIQKRIVQNLYNSDVVVCDVSAKNPNVMFELGLRLAFDKPTVIIKDDKTDYSFDTSIIEHVGYPRDLRFGKVRSFKKLLCEKVAATYLKGKDDPKHSTFLKSFGTFKVATLTEESVPAENLIVEVLNEMKGELAVIRHRVQSSSDVFPRSKGSLWPSEAVDSVWASILKSDSCERNRSAELDRFLELAAITPGLLEKLELLLARVRQKTTTSSVKKGSSGKPEVFPG